ncbi:hypothetical protein LPE509_01232 [Legionella pneumophila subsp. pneumophila LPE509]|nr:hypothetical protein LPE509_01232 [Legionella pneumophila subsp. pneumophila LPE509]
MRQYKVKQIGFHNLKQLIEMNQGYIMNQICSTCFLNPRAIVHNME